MNVLAYPVYRTFFLLALTVSAGPLALPGQAASAPTSAPAFPNESLEYNITWPSGVVLGEARWTSRNIGSIQNPVQDTDLTFDARIPGFTLINSYHSVTTGNYCLDKLTRDIEHGSTKTSESETVDPKTKTVTRKTESGGESTFAAPDCIHDALTLMFLTRRDLAAGRIPVNQSVLLGSKYDVQMTNLGPQKVKSGDRTVDADRIGCDIKGPSANLSVQIDFARDAVRTPLTISIPLAMGTFRLELAR